MKVDFQSVFISMVDVFSSYKDFQSAMGKQWKYGYNNGISVVHKQLLLLYSEN